MNHATHTISNKKKTQTKKLFFYSGVYCQQKGNVHSCIFSIVSSLYLPLSLLSCRDLALRSRIFLRSLSSFSLVITTCKQERRGAGLDLQCIQKTIYLPKAKLDQRSLTLRITTSCLQQTFQECYRFKSKNVSYNLYS